MKNMFLAGLGCFSKVFVGSSIVFICFSGFSNAQKTLVKRVPKSLVKGVPKTLV